MTDKTTANYDPLLAELLEQSAADDSFTVLVEIEDTDNLPPEVTVVTQFGNIATLRVRQKDIPKLISTEYVSQLEVSRSLVEPELEDYVTNPSRTQQENQYSPENRGRGVVVGVLDWGLDFTLPNFQEENGNSRLLAIWDQRGNAHSAPSSQNRWGYGTIHSRDAINAALKTENPFQTLNYFPSDADSKRRGEWQGTHGTHVTDIAAGSSHVSHAGIASEADIVFVHLARTSNVLGNENLGDSASLLEAIDFIFSTAGDRPCVINMSVGAHGGPHDGSTLVERGIDQAVWMKDGRAVVNSAGNYFNKRSHAEGKVTQNEVVRLSFVVPPNDDNGSELEIFYDHPDTFHISLIDPSGNTVAESLPGSNPKLFIDNKKIGRLYHNTRIGNQKDRHIDLMLNRHAPSGQWEIIIAGKKVRNGRFHAWIERENGKRPYFIEPYLSRTATTGTLCNGKYSITVGAHDDSTPAPKPGSFSSSGPTRDGRIKPELSAPGVKILAAKSSPPGHVSRIENIAKSGTSMAAPQVAGAVAIIFSEANRLLSITETRALLFTSLDKPDSHKNVDDLPSPEDIHRFGYGMLNLARTEETVRQWNISQQYSENIFLEEPLDMKTQITNDLSESIIEAETVESRCRCDSQQLNSALSFSSDTQNKTLHRSESNVDLYADLMAPDNQLQTSESFTTDVANTILQQIIGTGVSRLFTQGSVTPNAVQQGDVLLRPIPGFNDYISVVTSSPEYLDDETTFFSEDVESAGKGWYATVLEFSPNDSSLQRQIKRKIANHHGEALNSNQLIRLTT